MRYRIISDTEGRIRVRFGAYAFEKTLESCIERLTAENSFVLSAKAHSANGSLLICYKKGMRRNVISFIETLDFRKLAPLDEETAAREVDEEFGKKLTKLVICRLVRRYIVPAPLRPLFVICRASKYILSGLILITNKTIDKKSSHNPYTQDYARFFV